MTVSVQIPLIDYTGDGTTKIFTYDFRVIEETDLYVYIDDVVQTSGYTVSGIDDPNGGEVTFTTAPSNGALVTLRRKTPINRSTDYTYAGSLDADILDSDFDRIVTMIQDRETTELSLSDSNPHGWDAKGNRIINVGTPIDDADAATKEYTDHLFIHSLSDSKGAYQLRQAIVATEGQKTFTLTVFEYVPALHNISVYINGVRQVNGTYSEPSSTTITFSEGLNEGDVVEFISNEMVSNGDYEYVYTSAHGGIPRTLDDRLQDIISVKDFGALGDGVTDDGPAFTAAFDYIRSVRDNDNALYPACLHIPAGRYYIGTSINATGIRAQGWGIQASGALLLGHTTGKPVLDMLGSGFGHIKGLNIIGDDVDTPTVGMQIGRPASGVSCGGWQFNDLTIDGSYTIAGVYNYAAEGNIWTKSAIRNRIDDNTAYAMIAEGINYTSIVSDYQTVQTTPGTIESFLDAIYHSCTFAKHTTGRALRLTRTSRHKFIGCYGLAFDDYAIELYNDVTGHKHLHLDIHCETEGMLGSIIITGNAVQVMRNIEIYDNNANASEDLIHIDTGVTSVTFYNLDMRVAFLYTPTVGLVNDETKIKIYGGTITIDDPEYLTKIEGVYDINFGAVSPLPVLGKGTYPFVVPGENTRYVKGSTHFIGAVDANFDLADLDTEDYVKINSGNVSTISPTGTCQMYFNSGAATALSQIITYGKNSAGDETEYTQIRGSIDDNTAGAENGVLRLYAMKSGAPTILMQVNGGLATNGIQIYVGGSLKAVSEGDADTGGTGYRVLRVAN